MERIEEYTLNGKNIVYIDLTGARYNDDFVQIVKDVHSVIEKYPMQSVYTITNIENIRFDSNAKKVIADYMERNRPYVIKGVIIGLDGIKKMMVNTVVKLSGRTNFNYSFTKEGAIEWILQQP